LSRFKKDAGARSSSSGQIPATPRNLIYFVRFSACSNQAAAVLAKVCQSISIPSDFGYSIKMPAI
jgi:hypothetical protein